MFSFKRLVRETGPQQEKCIKVMCPWLWSLCGALFSGRRSCWSPSETLLSVLVPKTTPGGCRGQRTVQSLKVAGDCEKGVTGKESCVDGGKFYLSPLTKAWVPLGSVSDRVTALLSVSFPSGKWRMGNFFLGCVGASRPDEMKGDRKGPRCSVGVFCLVRQLC